LIASEQVAYVGTRCHALQAGRHPGNGPRPRRHLAEYKYGGLSDVSAYVRKEGLTWKLGEKTRTETALGDWIGQCAQAGRLPPTDPRRTTSSVERAARARGVQR